MKAVILTAGKGERMQPLSFGKQKHLVKILGKSIIEHNLDQLDGLVNGVVLVIRADDICKAIRDTIGQSYKRLKIEYAIQKEALGTGDAAKSALPIIGDKFILMNGDDLYFKEDIEKVLKRFPCLLAKKAQRPQFFGVVGIKNGTVSYLIEKPQRPVSDLVNIGFYYLPKNILNYSIKKSARGEYEFPDYVKEFIKDNKMYIVEADQWFPVSFCWNVLEANEALIERMREANCGTVEKDCRLSGKVIIGKGTVVKSGTYIEGPVYIGKNCVIGPNCFLRNFASIGNNCRIGQAVEIDNSVIGDKTNIARFSYIGDSIIGVHCSIGAETITANFRDDGETIKTEIRGELIDTQRKRFGAVLADNVKTGAGTLIYPGRKIWPNKTTLPGERVVRDVK